MAVGVWFDAFDERIVCKAVGTPSLQSLERGIAILQMLNGAPGSSIEAAATRLEIKRGTTYRLLETLRRVGYVRRGPERGKYHVDKSVQRLNSSCRIGGHPPSLIQNILQKFSRQCNWPIAIMTPNEMEMVVRIATDDSAPFMVPSFRVGSRLPIMNSASGKTYLAFCEAPIRQAVLYEIAQTGKPNFKRSNTSAELTRDIDMVRRAGYSFECNEEKVTTLAIPLFVSEQIVGALITRFYTPAVGHTLACETLLPVLSQVVEEITALNKLCVS